MTTLAPATAPFLPPRARRHAGIALTLLVHALLLLGWHTQRRPAPAPPDPGRTTIQWIQLRPAPAPAPRRADEHSQVMRPRTPARAEAITLPRPPMPAADAASVRGPAPASAPAAAPAATTARAGQAATPSADTSASAPPPSAAALLEQARRAAGGIDRALRKENNPYIVAPADSPQLRMRRGIEAAADLAPNAWYEAPKTAELVNNTGDGARRDRVITGNGTYCITERAPTTSIDMIEKHGKQRITNCPDHETPANAQAWRTARD